MVQQEPRNQSKAPWQQYDLIQPTGLRNRGTLFNNGTVASSPVTMQHDDCHSSHSSHSAGVLGTRYLYKYQHIHNSPRHVGTCTGIRHAACMLAPNPRGRLSGCDPKHDGWKDVSCGLLGSSSLGYTNIGMEKRKQKKHTHKKHAVTVGCLFFSSDCTDHPIFNPTLQQSTDRAICLFGGDWGKISRGNWLRIGPRLYDVGLKKQPW